MKKTLHTNLQLVWLLITFTFLALPQARADILKKSISDLCHPPESKYYDHTLNFIAFESIPTCIDSGGQLPKSLQSKSRIKLKHHNAGYAREKFGQGWADDDDDCQNSRMEALISLSTSKVQFATIDKCRVIAGRWISPFTGNVIHDASKIDVDHVVPLKWAWENGADEWSKEKREMFANDLRNLWPVEQALNRQKRARGPDEWLPPSGQCQYVLRFFLNVKRYELNGEQLLRSLAASICD